MSSFFCFMIHSFSMHILRILYVLGKHCGENKKKGMGHSLFLMLKVQSDKTYPQVMTQGGWGWVPKKYRKKESHDHHSKERYSHPLVKINTLIYHNNNN